MFALILATLAFSSVAQAEPSNVVVWLQPSITHNFDKHISFTTAGKFVIVDDMQRTEQMKPSFTLSVDTDEGIAWSGGIQYVYRLDDDKWTVEYRPVLDITLGDSWTLRGRTQAGFGSRDDVAFRLKAAGPLWESETADLSVFNEVFFGDSDEHRAGLEWTCGREERFELAVLAQGDYTDTSTYHPVIVVGAAL